MNLLVWLLLLCFLGSASWQLEKLGMRPEDPEIDADRLGAAAAMGLEVSLQMNPE
jgi:hypothetical protein